MKFAILAKMALPVAGLMLATGCQQLETTKANETKGTTKTTTGSNAERADLTKANILVLKDQRRVLDLQGGRNFRDLGGYRTADSQQVKWGKVYRSGSPASLTQRDYKTLGKLGINIFCDLRTNEEREKEPNGFVKANDNIGYWTRDYSDDFGALMQVLTGKNASAEKSRTAMTDFYRKLPMEHAESYR